MYSLHATAESEPNTKWPKEDLQLHRCEQRLWGIFLTPVRTSTFLFQSYWLVIGKGRKVVEQKTSKHKAFDPHSLKRHSPSSLMCQDNRNWIFYKSSIWKPIKLSCGNDGLLPGGLLSDKLAFNACAVQCCILKHINVNVEFLLMNRFLPIYTCSIKQELLQKKDGSSDNKRNTDETQQMQTTVHPLTASCASIFPLEAVFECIFLNPAQPSLMSCQPSFPEKLNGVTLPPATLSHYVPIG